MRPTARLVALVVMFAITLPAVAAGLDRATATSLARRAATGDEAARRELLTATEVDGAPVDLTAALDGASPEEQRSRLDTLARVLTVPAPPADTARRARTILAQPRFAAASPSWWDRFWRRILIRFLDLLGRLGSVGGGGLVAAGLALVGVVVLAVAVTAELGRRRARRVETERSFRRAAEAGFDPEDVERSADRAAAAGDWSEAVRLRFLSGLLRLDQMGVIRFAPGLTTHEVAETLDSPTFDRLAAGFDAVVYGGRPAGADDDARARRDWAELLGLSVR